MPDYPVGLITGDIILTGKKSQGIVSLAIKLGSKLRYGFKSKEASYSHSALVLHQDDDESIYVAEALKNGVKIRKVQDHHSPEDIDVIRVWWRSPFSSYGETDVDQVHNFAMSVVDARTKYGFWTFAGLALYCLTGSKVCVQKAGTAICSGFVCDALTRAGFIWERPPYSMMPADIYHHFGSVDN